ncbi:MAG: hypothetical protein HUK05_05180 [Prevotella sp.]|nr:hypothetical protein [Prevotella sp.]
MKKLYTLALSLLMGVCAFAQIDETFVFTDEEGNIIPNGTTITVNLYEEAPITGDMMFPSGLYVKNNSTANALAGMKFNIKTMDNGEISHCFPGNCQRYKSIGEVVREGAFGIKAGENKDIESEWFPTAKGKCTVTYTILLMELIISEKFPKYAEKAVGATVTVNYIYDDNSTSIKDITLDKKSANKYNLNGQIVNNDYKGVVIKSGKKYLNK